MGETLHWSQKVKLSSGLELTASKSASIEAYDLVEVSIPAGAAGLVVEVQPSPGSAIEFLTILPSGQLDEGLKYKSNSSNEITLDGPQTFLGHNVVEHMLGNNPQSLEFSNTSNTDALVRILVGRKAVAAAPIGEREKPKKGAAAAKEHVD